MPCKSVAVNFLECCPRVRTTRSTTRSENQRHKQR